MAKRLCLFDPRDLEALQRLDAFCRVILHAHKDDEAVAWGFDAVLEDAEQRPDPKSLYLLFNEPLGRLADFGGPEVLTFSEAFDQWLQIRQRPVRTMRIPLPSAVRNAATAMSISDPDSRRGTITWVDWLGTHTAE